MRQINKGSIIVESIRAWDAPDFVDAYIEYAEYDDGTPLNDDELEALTNDYDFLYDQIIRKLY